MKVTMIDPPMGWKFGFPRVLPEDVDNVLAWLVEQGYPQEVIDEHGKHFYCRQWSTFICPECYLPDPDHKMDCSRNI